MRETCLDVPTSKSAGQVMVSQKIQETKETQEAQGVSEADLTLEPLGGRLGEVQSGFNAIV